jgi:hypothetical protein
MNVCNQSLNPVYITEQINQPFTLYEGNMKFLSSSNNQDAGIQGNGLIKFDWFPSLKLKYRFNCDEFILSDPIRHTLELGNPKVSIKATRTFLSLGQENFASGFLNEPVTITSNPSISYLIFHITNFHDYMGENVQNSSIQWTGRLLLEAHNWRVTIDSLEPKLRKELISSLEDEGGYAFTHTAKLERIDDHLFTPKEALDILSGLSYFLAFVRGMWVGPFFPVGFDSSDHCIWEQWNFYKASPYKVTTSWFPLHKPQNLTKAYVGFMERWIDPDWQEPLQLAIYWYVESNLQVGGIEGSIIIAQAAFELLYEFLLGSSSIKNDAHIKLKKLFRWANLPLDFHDMPCDTNSLKNLTRFAEEKNINLTQAITEVRNRITHPKCKKDRTSILHSIHLRYETWRVSLWYLELLILRLFDYQGLYKNRMKFNWEGNYDELPWMPPH